MIRLGRLFPRGAAAALLAAACSATPTPAPTPVSLTTDIDIDAGRTLHVSCAGPLDSGMPTVVFENAGGASLDTWSSVVTAIKPTVRSCAYDRAGLGRSPVKEGSRTTWDQVDDLHALLAKLGVTGKIVLVAHSVGGFNAILFTALAPDQVAGAVLVDIQSPTLTARFRAELPEETADEPEALRGLREGVTTFEGDFTMNPEHLAIAESTQLVLDAPGFGDRPVEILWAEHHEEAWQGLDPELAERIEAALQAARADVEVLANEPTVTGVDAGHFIQEEQPQVVVDAILRVLEALKP